MTLAVRDETNLAIMELENTRRLCSELMKSPHYQKMGEAGIYAIVQKAKSIGMSPMEALNGGMYLVQGKVEMQGQSMLALIRQNGHSVQMDAKSTDSLVIMHGKRCDTGDTWTVSFGVEDAKRAGIFRNQWEKYPKTMCIWRCVSMLGRFLFSDILKGCYVQGEISESLLEPVEILPVEKVEVAKVTKEEAEKLIEILGECSEQYQSSFKRYMNKLNIPSFYDIPADIYHGMLEKATKKKEENQVSKIETIEVINESGN